MRLLAVAVLLAFAVPSVSADDKPEAKAKEAVLGLLKAVKAKDIDAIMKMSATPFAYKDGERPKVHKTADDLKTWLKERLDEIKDTDKVPTEIETLVPFDDIKDKIEDKDDRKLVEDVVGKGAYVAIIEADGKKVIVLVKFEKDGKAKIAGIGR